MNDLGPKKAPEQELGQIANAVDFRSDPDVSVGIDRREFVAEGSVDPEPGQNQDEAVEKALHRQPSFGLDAVLASLETTQEFDLERISVEELEHERRSMGTKARVTDELFERVQSAMQQLEIDVEGADAVEVVAITELKGSVRELLQSVAPALKTRGRVPPREAERIMMSAGALRRSLQQIMLQARKAPDLTEQQTDIFRKLEELLDRIGTPPKAARERSQKTGASKDPLLVRVFKSIIAALRRFLLGVEPEEQEASTTPQEIPPAPAEQQPHTSMEPEAEPQVPESATRDAHMISGAIIDAHTRKGIPGIQVFGGALGTRVTDSNGEFYYANVPDGSAYVIGPYSETHRFTPPLRSGVLKQSRNFEFVAETEESS